MNGAEVPPQLLESMEATVAREIAEERAQQKVRNTRWQYWAHLIVHVITENAIYKFESQNILTNRQAC